jgi:microcystin-dependent protein
LAIGVPQAEDKQMTDQYIGEIRLFGFPRVPTGWLACNGQLLPISQFDVLYAVIGTTYGGDGQQHFQLPDLQGRVPVGQGQGQGLPPYVLGQLAGEEQHTLLNSELPSHSHALTSSTTVATTATPGPTVHLATISAGYLYAPAASAAPYDVMAPCLSQTGGSLPHNNMMPTIVANYCIAYVGIYPSG